MIELEEAAEAEIDDQIQAVADGKHHNILVLYAGAGTSAMLAMHNRRRNRKLKYRPQFNSWCFYGSHYDIMKDFDMIVLAPQVNSYYEDIKKDTDNWASNLFDKGAEYIKLTHDPKGAVQFVLSHFE